MHIHKPTRLFGAAALVLPLLLAAQGAAFAQAADPLTAAARDAESELRQTFVNLQFEDFGPAPVKGPIYQATAGGRIIYYAPDSEHLLFAEIYDRNGQNLTALAQNAASAKKLAGIDTGMALAIGPAGAPTVSEFTDPDCPYCRALDSGIHAEAAAKAEHVLCSPDKEAAFKAIYAGTAPTPLRTCAEGKARVEAHAGIVGKTGITGTPTLIADGQMISGFRQAEIEAFLDGKKALANAGR